jgi:hypothetical protein
MPHAPPRPNFSRPEVNGNGLAAKTARIDLDGWEDEELAEGSWEMRENYQDAPEGELNWVLRGKEEDLDEAVAVFGGAVEKAKAATHGEHVGLCCLRPLIEIRSWAFDWFAAISVPSDHWI